MSNYNTLKTTINANIKQNGNQEITGQILNSVLNQMVTTLGAGYQFAGVATNATNPGTPDAKVFYIANGKGTYTNFGGLEVTEDEVVVLYYDTEWHKVATGIALQAKLSELESKVNIINEGTISYTNNNYSDNKQLDASGQEVSDNGYITTDYIDISEIKSALIRVELDVDDSITKAVLYNSSKEYLDRYTLSGYAGTGRNINLLENSAFVRVTFKKPVSNSCSVSGYYAGNPRVIWSPKSETKMVNVFDSQTAFSYSRKMSSFVEKGEVAQGEYLITKSAHIYPNSCLSAHIQGAISNIKIGCGYNGKEFEHYAFYAEISGTEIKIYYVEGGTPLQETLKHGLTLDAKTDIAIVTENESSYVRHSYIILTNSVGERYKHELLCWFGSGNAFVKNDGTTTINAEVRLFPRSLTKNIWLFGDSYFSLWNNDRWPYYLFENKFTNALFNHLSGQSPAEGFEDLKNLLSLGYAPKMIIWCHGMNGAGDTIVDNNYVINPQKKEIIDWLIDFCKTNSIILVLATIPTALVGNTILLHEGFNEYVRNCGERYIDFADAVGAKADGSWTAGLCADGVHPTEAGAKVLFARAISDCPELTE